MKVLIELSASKNNKVDLKLNFIYTYTTMNIKDQIVPFKEFRLNAPKYIKALEAGASFLVMKRSRPAFRLEPVFEVWETIGDFSKLRGGGISAKKLAKALQ
ncbi:hypothetical protein A3J61_01655 [Candidatus Nomurabacteria bacterium RIFCSPHIGHO2_02_FULL_38_15]|uniref:Uncharacterized protein n=1 Tax=Candidatus Nomurabacteria bacterium RIFCSPHIGHO2_02_FULL_38_15 TaxID=1801752 RepID=A0A1F6VPV4_9BACT|nr:MAG: hypothetical protein A3J61_01655 [Candidatus Nomurabacteria bacterium RIFCSPHIGHO2_02_FULL_38_15]